MKVSEEMLYAGGNNWVLERLEDVDGKKTYFRLSDTGFSRSSLSYEEVQDATTVAAIDDYWEVGVYNQENAGWWLDEMIASGWQTIFNEMVESWPTYSRTLSVKKVIEDVKEAHEPYLVGLIQTMAEAKKQFDASIHDKIDSDPTVDDIQIVIEGHAFNIGSMYIDICDLVYSLLDDIQKFASHEIVGGDKQ